jgi:hypothetical protein
MILKAFHETFESGKVYLFGSRIDSAKKGGDIDLYLVPDKKFDDEHKRKIDFLLQVKKYIGEQKVDVVVAKDNSRPIERQALKEGVVIDEKQVKIAKYLNECKKHSFRIDKAHEKLKSIFPLSAGRYENLNDDEVEAIDQYLFRFAKLQDTIGEKLFRLIVSEYVEDIYELTFMDVLHYLEKIGILDDANTWKRLRSIRNEISHQYDDEPDGMAQALNHIFAQKDELIGIYHKIETKIGQRQSSRQ